MLKVIDCQTLLNSEDQMIWNWYKLAELSRVYLRGFLNDRKRGGSVVKSVL